MEDEGYVPERIAFSSDDDSRKRPAEEQVDESKKEILVSNVPELLRETDLQMYFSRFGPIRDIRVKRGFAFIRYERPDSVESILSLGDSHLVGRFVVGVRSSSSSSSSSSSASGFTNYDDYGSSAIDASSSSLQNSLPAGLMDTCYLTHLPVSTTHASLLERLVSLEKAPLSHADYISIAVLYDPVCGVPRYARLRFASPSLCDDFVRLHPQIHMEGCVVHLSSDPPEDAVSQQIKLQRDRAAGGGDKRHRRN